MGATGRKIIVNDCTLRDGMHALNHQYSVEQMVAVARKLDEAKVDIVEVSHGDGLNGNSFNYGFSAHTETEYLLAVREVLTHTKLAALLLPGIGTIKDMKHAVECGIDTIRIATHCTEADISKQHIQAGRQFGLDVVGFLMMAHMIPTSELVAQAKLMESYGAHCVYVTDSAGALLMDETREKVTALREALDCQVGFHNHNNLGLGVANSIVAIEAGADRIDGSVAGMGAGAGNCALEVFIAVCDRMGIRTDIDLYPLMDCADQIIRPLMTRPVQTDGNALMLGYAGVYSSFLIHTERAAKKFGVDSRDILVELGKRRMIGGQEDMIVDVAMDLVKSKKIVENMQKNIIEELAKIVDEAARHAKPIPMLTASHPEMTLEDAYLIQRESMGRRFERGEALVGLKMGLTSQAKMVQMGVHNPIYGHLTDEMSRNSGATLVISEHCHPRVEPEIAFLLEKDLKGRITIAQAKAAIGGICAALEVIDSRFQDFKFTLIDVVADNASSTRYVLGDVVESRELDVSNLGMVMKVDGQVREIGSSAAILEHPLKSLVALVHMLDEVGEGLKAGQVILAGGATKAIPLEPNTHVSLEVQNLGSVEFFVKP